MIADIKRRREAGEEIIFPPKKEDSLLSEDWTLDNDNDNDNEDGILSQTTCDEQFEMDRGHPVNDSMDLGDDSSVVSYSDAPSNNAHNTIAGSANSNNTASGITGAHHRKNKSSKSQSQHSTDLYAGGPSAGDEITHTYKNKNCNNNNNRIVHKNNVKNNNHNSNDKCNENNNEEKEILEPLAEGNESRSRSASQQQKSEV